MASSSNSGLRWTYDVFLSFKGTDVWKGFIGHLYAALRRSGFNTFIDEEKIEDAEKIGAESLKGIQESKFCLVILSKDYAFSSWCLEELVHILKYKKSDNVWPVFYDVDPSHVEEIKESYKDAFAEHEKRFMEDVLNKWKDALQQVSYLKGLDLRKHLDGHEAKNIYHIVEKISEKLNQTMLSVAIHPVGIYSRAKEAISLIADGESRDIRIVGIYGMGGIGKSTIAKEVYNSLFHKFEGSCFLENVRDVSLSKGIPYLQRQLLTEALKTKHEKIDDIDGGLHAIAERLHGKRVLLVLDDVDKSDQINEILGKRDWLSPGSRVIITTRSKDFLQPSELYWQYEVNKLDDSDSLQLLSLHAFDRSRPTKEYIKCAGEMVHYAGGIPLALEVLGSSLCGQSANVWNSRLEKLKVIANEDIHSKLKISYDSLGDTEKFIFLDIACFFIGYDKEYVISILDGCGFFPIDGINTLIRRCLVKVGSNNKLSMHNLLRDMGRETVRKQHTTDPGERSRLWHHEEVIEVLTDKMGTKAVEGLVVNIAGLKHTWKTKAFKKMKMLRLLQLNYASLEGRYEYISSKLRWLCWREFPFECIPFDLSLEYLIALDMRYSSLIQFSEEGKSLKKLKFLNLSHSHKLIELPDFEGCQNLEKLMLKDCIRLEKVHDTIGLLTRLIFLNFQDCKNLKNLPVNFGVLRRLEKLNMSGCSKLEEVPESIGWLTCLRFLNLQNCKNLKNLPRSIGDVKSLQELNMSGCSKLEGLPESMRFLASLIFLNLQNCENLKNLPGSIGHLKSLEKLEMSGCLNLEYLPESTGHFASLLFWDLHDCKTLKNFPRNIFGLRSLKELNMSGCSKLEELPEDLGNLKSLVVFNLDGTAINTLPETIQNLKKLETLSLRECHLVFSPRNSPHVISLLPYSLKELDLGYCNILDGVIPYDLQGLSLLEELKLCGNHFTSLPASIGSLPNLVTLWLNDCRRLQSIPQLHLSLGSLHANQCPTLESINLTNFRGESTLELDGCLSLKEIDGFFNLEPLKVEIAEKLLRSSSLFTQELITNIHVRKIDNLTTTNEISPLQALSEKGIHSIFLPGNEIPTWFCHQSEGDTISLRVPQLNPGFKIIGIATCAIYAWRGSDESCYFTPYITISNKTKIFDWIYTPYISFFSSDVKQNMSWLGYWMFNNLEKGIDELDANWRFKDEMEEGDEVEFSIDMGLGVHVKKCGIHLLYQPIDQGSQSDDLEIISHATSKHHRRFLRSRPWLLTIGDDQEITPKLPGAQPENKEFFQWMKQREEKLNQMACANLS